MRWSMVIGLLVALESQLLVAEDAHTDPFLRPEILEVQEMHKKSQEGDRDATVLLVDTLEKLHSDQPDDMLIKSYLGSAYALRARDIGFGPAASRYLRLGYDTMNEAVDAVPDQLPPRFIRAATNMHLPVLPFFPNPRRQAREDFQILLKQIEEHPDVVNDKVRQAVYYYAGLSFKQLKQPEQAREAWNKGLIINAGSVVEEKIVAELDRLRG